MGVYFLSQKKEEKKKNSEREEMANFVTVRQRVCNPWFLLLGTSILLSSFKHNKMLGEEDTWTEEDGFLTMWLSGRESGRRVMGAK